jgi:hypothetical protein
MGKVMEKTGVKRARTESPEANPPAGADKKEKAKGR